MKKRKIQYCPICGRRNIDEFAKGYCGKHYHQIKKYGKVLDNNPRTKYDPNEFRFKKNIVEFDTYELPSNRVKQTYIIDTEDYLKVSQYKWQTLSTGYAGTRDIKTHKIILLHRLIMDAKPGQQIDHIDQDITNNTKENLRYCDNGLNMANRKPYNSLQLKGVQQHKNGKYSAYIRRNNKQYHSNVYETFEEASFARYILEQIVYPEGLHQLKEFSLSEAKKQTIIQQVTSKIVNL